MRYLLLRVQLDELLSQQLDHVALGLVRVALDGGDVHELRRSVVFARRLEGRSWLPVLHVVDEMVALATT